MYGVKRNGLSDFDVHLFNEGRHYKLFEKLGAHSKDGRTTFSVWAPNAKAVQVIGDFNNWDPQINPMASVGSSGIWTTSIQNIQRGANYKFRIESTLGGYFVEKSDPYAIYTEVPPKTASRVWDLQYDWDDEQWMASRKAQNALTAPMSIYECHLGSWRRDEQNRPLSYLQLAEELPTYLKDMGFTHVEFMPVMEHPFYGSWGYQITNYFSPSARYGAPQDFMHLIDRLHQAGIGVILDWVPSHFPTDEHGLGYFDGTHLYEHEDPRQGFHPDWKSYIFNYGRNEIRSFLISNALFWLEKYHIDGLRVDAVASMLYLDYSREEGEWIPNKYGGRENIDAIEFLRDLNSAVYEKFPDTQTIAEESTAWPMVSRPTYLGGLGFGMKWDMGWMHDTLRYFSKEPVHRKFHHDDLTFRKIYAFNENFVLSFSHDEVVYGKKSILEKMPGDDWQKFAHVRLLYTLMMAEPGKKLVFMGSEFGQREEWAHEKGLNWDMLGWEMSQGLVSCVKSLHRLYKQTPELYENDFSKEHFEWLDASDVNNSIISWFRKDKDKKNTILFIGNFTPVPRENYQLGVDYPGAWREVFNSDAKEFGGSGMGNLGEVETAEIPSHGRPHSLFLTLPPLSGLFLKAPL